VAEFPPNPPSATPSLGRFFFSAEFCKAKCATKEDVALDPPNPFAGNAKELPFFFTNLKYFGNIKLLEDEFFIYKDTTI
jgi:hypothetical protein